MTWFFKCCNILDKDPSQGYIILRDNLRTRFAEMAELADAHGSGPCDSNIMRVQVPFPASQKYREIGTFFISCATPQSPGTVPKRPKASALTGTLGQTTPQSPGTSKQIQHAI